MLGSMSDDRDQLDPAEALMREVGAQLRRVRLERGQDLDEVGQHLRIKSTYLLGIEQGDLSAIPGRTYALGFLRSYADYLGFDGDDLITQIKSTVANLTDRTRLRMRTPLPESRLPKTPILVLSLAAVAGIYTGWSYLNHGSEFVIETVAEVPAGLRNLASGAFRGGDDGIAPRAGDVTRARPLPPPAATGPPAPEPRPAVARAAPLPAETSPGGRPAGGSPATAVPVPDRTAAVPPATVAPAPPATAPMTTAPAAGADPAAPPPAIAPEAAPGSPPDAARAYAMARPTATPAAPPEPPASAPAPGGEPQAPGSVPADAGAPEGGTVVPDAPETDAAGQQDQLAALPFDPRVIGPVGHIEEPENSDARVVLRAIESSWVHVSSPSGDYLRDRTLEPNDVFLVPNRADLELWTGNAGGLQVIVDGTVLAPLGTSGAVLHDVSLEPSSLRTRLGPPPER
jgi:hypothetical protein